MTDYARHPFVKQVSHYYGDTVLQIFIATAALMLLTAPFYGDTLRIELPFEIAGALILVALAALANPHNKTSMVANAIAAGVGMVIFETWALYLYQESSWAQFTLREIVAVLFLVAFYFSTQTVRAFVMHQVGKEDEPGEFENLEDSGNDIRHSTGTKQL